MYPILKEEESTAGKKLDKLFLALVLKQLKQVTFFAQTDRYSLGYFTGLLADITLDWKGLAGRNALAYWTHSLVSKKVECCE